MRKFDLAYLALAAVALSSCGKVSPLRPATGNEMPVAAQGAKEASTAEQLMEPSTQARPGRSDELLKQSEERKDDKFDLPPTR